MNDRLFDRLVAAGSIALLVILALGTYYLAEVARRQARVSTPAAKTEPDYFITDFKFVRRNSDGQAAFEIRAKRLTHYPDRDRSELEEPQVIAARPDKSVLSINAKRGTTLDLTTEASAEVILEQQVRLVRTPGPGQQAIRVESEGMTIRPDEETATSELPVKILTPNAVLESVGFSMNNRDQTLILNQSVRATWNAK